MTTAQSPNDPSILKLMAGFNYQLQVDASSGLTPGGTWSAEYGNVSASGSYTAPSYKPPYSEDTVTYTDPVGATARIEIFVDPDPAVPATSYPRYISYAVGAKDAPSYEVNPTAQLIGNNGSVLSTGALQTLANASPKVPIVEGTYPTEFTVAPTLTDCVDVALATDVPVAANKTAYRTEVVDELAVASDTMILVVSTDAPQKAKPKKCKPGRLFPPPPFWELNCTNGPANMYIDGPVVQTGPKEIPPPQTGQMEFSVELNAALEAAGLANLSAGFHVGTAYPLTRRLQAYHQTKKQDKYCCKNGTMVWCGTRTCYRDGAGEWTTPKWAAFADNYPINGNPDPDLWTDWNCK